MKIIRHPLFMRPTPESELEQAIDRALRQLPDRRAPDSLVPQVLAALAARERLPWWRKSYACWPWTARILFLALSSGLAGLLIYFTWGLTSGASVGGLTEELGQMSGRLGMVRGLGSTLGNAAVLLVQSAGPWFLWVSVGVVGACYLTTMALGTFCWRLVSQRI